MCLSLFLWVLSFSFCPTDPNSRLPLPVPTTFPHTLRLSQTMLTEEKELPEGHTAFQRPGLDRALPDPIRQPLETLFSLSSYMTASCHTKPCPQSRTWELPRRASRSQITADMGLVIVRGWSGLLQQGSRPSIWEDPSAGPTLMRAVSALR